MSIKVVTGPNTLFSFVNIFQPKSINGSDPKYSMQVRIPKDDRKTIAKIENAMKQAYEEGAAKLKGNSKSVPAYETLKKPLRDGETEFPDDESYKGYFFINANNSQKPGVVDGDCNPILDPSEVYSGCFGRVSMNFFAFNNNGNKGIAASINNVQKLRDGTPLSGHSRPEDDFGGEEDDDDDFLS